MSKVRKQRSLSNFYLFPLYLGNKASSMYIYIWQKDVESFKQRLRHMAGKLRGRCHRGNALSINVDKFQSKLLKQIKRGKSLQSLSRPTCIKVDRFIGSVDKQKHLSCSPGQLLYVNIYLKYTTGKSTGRIVCAWDNHFINPSSHPSLTRKAFHDLVSRTLLKIFR